MNVVTIKKNNTYTVNDMYQWDTNRKLAIYGLNFSVAPEIHFANAKMTKAIVKQVESFNDGVITVTIPNILLEKAIPITVFICTHEGEEFSSRYSFIINIKARPKPEDYIAEDDEKIYSYNALENLINSMLVILKAENKDFHDETIAEVNGICDNAVSEMRDIVKDFAFPSKSGKTVFNSDGSITTTYNDGSSETVVFNEDGSITTTRNTLELGVKTETTKFNDDGSITVTVE